MFAEIMILAAFLLIVCAAAGIYSLLRITSAESMVLAIILLTGIMYGGVTVQQSRAAAILYALLAVLGLFLFIRRTDRGEKKAFFSPAFVALALIFAGCSILFHNAFIQNIDDFHQWAAAVKYMLERGHLPGQDFLGSAAIMMHSSTYHLFFQLIGGYHEGNMYTAAVLFYAAPLMLPIAKLNWKQLRSALWYVCTVMVALYHLYNHPYKSMYVDLPAATWAAGIGLWFAVLILADETRRKRRAVNVLCIGAAAVFSVTIKWGISILLLGFTCLYMAGAFLIAGSESSHRSKAAALFADKKIRVTLCVIIAALAAVLLIFGEKLIPVSLGGVKEALTFSSEKARLTFSALKDHVFSTRFHSRSRLRLTLFQMMCLMTILSLMLAGMTAGIRRKMLIWHSIFTPVVTVLYCAALYITYVSTFAYEESVSNAAVHRYFSCVILYLFFFMAAAFVLTDGEEREAGTLLKAVKGVMLAILVLSLTKHYISEASSLRSWDVSGSKKITAAKERMEQVKTEISDDDRVYLLYQKPTLDSMDEFTMCTLLYYMEDNISNYMKTPWKFTYEGSLQMLSPNDLTVDAFPELLNAGGYTYVWVYETDSYLRRSLKQVFDMEQTAEKGLYKIERTETGEITGLSYAGDF